MRGAPLFYRRACKKRLISIVSLNLHRFQRYNRRYGYEEGERVLHRLAASMEENSGILLCGRVAEDHFLFLTASAGNRWERFSGTILTRSWHLPAGRIRYTA